MRLKRSLALFLSVLLVLGVVTPVAFAAEDTITRIKGADRWATAVAVCQEGWESADTVVLANGDNFADALAGVPLAHQLGAPLLLTKAASLPDVIADEIERLDPTKVIVLGGTVAVSDAVVDEIEDMGITVERIKGADRFSTAAAVAAHEVFEDADTVFIAYGRNFPDALAAASYAAALGYPILLSEKNSIPEATDDFLDGIENIYVIGGTGVIGDIYEGAERISGANRYLTALELAKEFAPNDTKFFIATGAHFADALTGAVLAAQQGTGLLLVGSTLEDDVEDFLATNVVEVVAFGGTAAVSAAVGNAIMEAVAPPEEAVLADIKALTSTISATTDEDGNLVRDDGATPPNPFTEVYFYGLDQFGKDFSINSVTGMDIEISLNGMPLSTDLGDYNVTTDGLLVIDTDLVLLKGDVLEFTFETDDLEADFTYVVRDAAVGRVAEVEVTADETSIAALETVEFSVEAWNQWGNPETVATDDFRWVIRDEDGTITYNKTDLDTNPMAFDDAGTFTVQAFLLADTSVRDTVTIKVSPADLTSIDFNTEGSPYFNNEENIVGVLVPNTGSVLDPADVDFLVEVPSSAEYSASDMDVWAKVRGGDLTNKNDIVVVVKAVETGTYTITPYVGSSYDDDDAVLGNSMNVTIGVQPEVASMTIESFKANELAVGQNVEKAISFYNEHGEEVKILTSALEITETAGLEVTAAADSDGYITLTFNASTKGTKTVTFVTGDVSKSITVTAVEAAYIDSVTLAKTVSVIAGDAYAYDADDDREDVLVADGKAYVAMPITFKNQYGFAMDVLQASITLPEGNFVYLATNTDGDYVAAGASDPVTAIGVHVATKPATGYLTFTVTTLVDATPDPDVVIESTVTATVKDARAATTFEIEDFDQNIMAGRVVEVALGDITVYDQYGVEFAGTLPAFQVTGQSLNDTIEVATATVDPDGFDGWNLTAADASGTETITFTMGDDVKSIAYKMTVVTNDQITKVEFEPIGTLNYQATTSLYGDNAYDAVDAEIKVYAGTLEVAYTNVLYWSSSNSAVASVSAGTVTAGDVGDDGGSATISVETVNGISGSVVVNVVDKAPVLTSIELEEYKSGDTTTAVPTKVDVGATIDFANHVKVYDETGVEVLLTGWTGASVEYRALNTNATISGSAVTGEAEGTVTVRVTLFDAADSRVDSLDWEVTVEAAE